MAIIVQKKLICVEAKKISFKGREGKLIEKWKYLFLDKDGNLIQGFLDTNDYEQDVQEINEGDFDESKAKTYLFEKKFFNGQTTDKLLPRKR
jgi:translation elongation factor P/translation initiation factor 5A